jgi:hypothetical protein
MLDLERALKVGATRLISIARPRRIRIGVGPPTAGSQMRPTRVARSASDGRISAALKAAQFCTRIGPRIALHSLLRPENRALFGGDLFILYGNCQGQFSGKNRMSQFESRPIGRTQLKVTVFGQGGAPLGGHRAASPWPQAEAVMDFAWDNGIRYFDTAPFYGYGLSEHYFGNALRKHKREDFVLSTKVGRLLRPRVNPYDPNDLWKEPLPFEPVFDYSYDGMMRSFEDSLQRLGTQQDRHPAHA